MSEDFRKHTCMECAWSLLRGFHGRCTNRAGGRLGLFDDPLFCWEIGGDCPDACPSFVPLHLRDPNSKITDEQWDSAEERLMDSAQDFPNDDSLQSRVRRFSRWVEQGDRRDVLYTLIMQLPVLPFEEEQEGGADNNEEKSHEQAP